MIDFIHIGHGKSLSSSLQTVFLTASNYDCSKPNELIVKIQSAAREAFKTGKVEDINFGIRFAPSDRVKVISSESMVYGSPLNESLPLCQMMMAKSFGKHTSKALLIVKNPISWIKSAYAQLLNEGGYLKFDEYLAMSERNGLANLNLAHILECWHNQGVEVVILSMEEFIKNPQSFWDKFEVKLGVPMPINAETLPKINSSNYDLLDLQRLLNELSDQLINIAKKNPHHDIETVLNIMQSYKAWGNRRAIEVMSPEEARLIRSYLNTNDADNNLPVALNTHSIKIIKECFIKPLECHAVPESILEDYVKEIEKTTANAIVYE